MRVTKKQQEEVDFLSKLSKATPTKEDIEEYILDTVHGEKGKESNLLIQAKRKLDITIAMWREDFTKGYLSPEELKEDFEYNGFLVRLVDSLIKSTTHKI